MTQQADPRYPAIDSSVDAETTAPGTPFDAPAPAQPAGWPPSAPAGYAAPPSPPGVGPMPPVPAPQAPLNTLSWLSVVMAFIVSPVAIVLGIIARTQITRTGERGRGLATLGVVLGAVFSLVGIASTIVVLLLAGQVSASLDAATSPVPAVSAGAPAAQAPAAVPAPAGTTDDDSAGQAQLMAGFIQVGSAAETMSADLDRHSGDLDAMQGDFSAYREAISGFRTTATTVAVTPDVRQKVDANLVPAIDRVLADLDTLSTSSSQSRLSGAADRLQTDSQAMVTAATAAVGG
ncbi:DUF4190 domain-containing protein [Actinomycetospora sp.]|jgi:hypothetical protein|uniref:DUF4190 domain-containing protein n=1 Tax=Actinomycetospora sp. TaxID=1872135 RepID=UPI002F3F3F97